MPVEMYTEPAMNLRPDGTLAPRMDRDGNTIIAYSPPAFTIAIGNEPSALSWRLFTSRMLTPDGYR